MLIENTVTIVQKSKCLTDQTQEAFSKNVDIVKKVSNIVDEIAAASQEQAQGISQINKAVMELDRVTQHNAAIAEEAAGASAEMNDQAALMEESVRELVVVIHGESVNGRGKDFHAKNKQVPKRTDVLTNASVNALPAVAKNAVPNHS